MAELGYHPATPGSVASLNDNLCGAGRFQASENGTITAISLWVAADGIDFTLSIYEDSAGSPGALLGVTGGAISSSQPRYQSQNIVGTPTIVSGNYYWLGFHCNASMQMGYDSTTWTSYYKASAYSSGAAPDPFPSSPTLLSDFKWAIFATYTPSGGGGLSPPPFHRSQRFFTRRY